MSQSDIHTAIISTPLQMWEKLAWDVFNFAQIQHRIPNERQPLAYAAMNVCLAASCLQDWTRKTLQAPKGAFINSVNLAVPEMPACAAIANTVKHLDAKEGKWTGGSVTMEWREFDENPDGYVLVHNDIDGTQTSLALHRFESLQRNWWNFLVSEGLASGTMYMPEWHQNIFRRMFGHPPVFPPPPPGAAPVNTNGVDRPSNS